MTAIQKKIVIDEHGQPQEVIIPWAQFCELCEELGLELDAEATADLREARRDWESGDRSAFSRFDNFDTPPYHRFMPAALDVVTHDALILPPDQCLALARQLLDSVDLEPEPGAEAAWEAEIARRIARFKAGESKPIPAREVFARLRQKFDRVLSKVPGVEQDPPDRLSPHDAA